MTPPLSYARPVDILIADDDAILRGALRHVLEQEGYRCSEAEDGRAAVELARLQSPRCAILDLAMPVLDGLAVARKLRSDPRTRGIRIHCLTGRSDLFALAQAADAGVESFLTKPMDATRLLQMVQEQLQNPEILRIGELSMDEAREQLDWWENAGYQGLHATYEEGKGFCVQCVREPPRWNGG